MRKLNPEIKDVNLCIKLAAISAVFIIFSLFAESSYAWQKLDENATDGHLDDVCYTAGEVGANNPIRRPVHRYRMGGVHTRFTLHQGICNSKDSNWYNPLIRVVSIAFGKAKKKDLGLNECKRIWSIRYCARMTYPELGKDVHGNVTGKNCDPEDENVKCELKPQICAYADPMDGGDTQSSYNPWHHRTDVDTFYDSLSTTIKVFLGPLGNLIGAIRSKKNHFVRRNLGCVDRPMSVGPPVWSNDQWEAIYYPPPFLDYAETSTFLAPAIRVHFCINTISGSLVDQNVKCEFRKDVDGAYIRGPTVPGDPLDPDPDGLYHGIGAFDLRLNRGMSYESSQVINITPKGLCTNAPGTPEDRNNCDAITTFNDTWGRRFEARISIDSPDQICVFKIREADGRTTNQLQDCLPRPGYMPLPSVTEVADPNLGCVAYGPSWDPVASAPICTDPGLNPDHGIMGTEVNIQFNGAADGGLNLQYLGDIETNGGTDDAETADLLERCRHYHQILFCVEPGPITDPIENSDPVLDMPDPRDPTTSPAHPDYALYGPPVGIGQRPIPPRTVRYRGWLCVEGYDTAPLVVGRPFKEPDPGDDTMKKVLYDETGQPVYDPPLWNPPGCQPETPGCTQNPDAKPVFKYFVYSEMIEGYDSRTPRPAGPERIKDVPNRFVPAGGIMENFVANQEVVAGSRIYSQIRLNHDQFYYNPPMTNEAPSALDTVPTPPVVLGPGAAGPFIATEFPFVESGHPNYSDNSPGTGDINLVPANPVMKRPACDVPNEPAPATPYTPCESDPYYIDGTARFDYDRPDRDIDPLITPIPDPEDVLATDPNYAQLAEPDAAILRPLTATELGMCVETILDVRKSYPPATGEPILVFPTAESILDQDWANETHINEWIKPEDLVNTPGGTDDYADGERCSAVRVQVWGAGAGGTSRPGNDSADPDTSGGSGGYIMVDYDLVDADLVNDDIPISIGMGGAVVNMCKNAPPACREDIIGLDGTRSSFGPNGNMVVAHGGKGHSMEVRFGSTFVPPIDCTEAGGVLSCTSAAAGGRSPQYDGCLVDTSRDPFLIDCDDTDDFEGGLYQSCMNGCSALDVAQGSAGNRHSEECGLALGGSYWSGVDISGALLINPARYVEPGPEKCDHEVDRDDSTMEEYRDPDLFLDETINPVLQTQRVGELFGVDNFQYSDGEFLNTLTTPPPANYSLPIEPPNLTVAPEQGLYAAGGCVANACDKCPAGYRPCRKISGRTDRCKNRILCKNTRPRIERVGLAAPGAHGRITVQCIRYEKSEPTATIIPGTTPNPSTTTASP